MILLTIRPVAGNYGARELRGISPTDIDTRAVFLEDAIDLTDRIKLVGALRYEELDLVRDNFNDSGVLEGSSFARDFDWVSVRLALSRDYLMTFLPMHSTVMERTQ